MSLIALAAAALLSAPSGEIAYLARAVPGPSRIHVISLDSGDVRAIGIEGAFDRPRWSPDGQRIAFTVNTPDGPGIYIADADGPDGQLVTRTHDAAAAPEWSSDGTRLAYTVGRSLDSQIAVYDAATGTETVWGGGRTSLSSPIWVSDRLVRLLIDPDRQNTPSLPPAFLSTRDEPELLIAVGCVGAPGAMTTDLFIVSKHDTTAIADTHMPSEGAYVEFAPAASAGALAFESNDGGDREVFVISSRSTFDLSNHHAADWSPVWAPDAQAIAFQSFRSGRSGIYQCVPRRAGLVREVAVHGDGDSWAPAWSLRSDWIAYVTDAGGAPAVYVVRPDGSERARVTPEGASANLPAWRPRR